MFTLDYTSIFLILLNVFVFVLFIFLIYAIFQSYKSNTTAEQELLRQDSYKKAMDILDKARVEALRMVKETEYLTDDTKIVLKKEFDSIVNKLSKQLSADLTATIKEESTQGVASIRNVSKEIENNAIGELKKFEGVSISMEKEALEELENFRQELHVGTIHNEETMQARLNKEYEEVRQRLAEYESAKMSQIDTKMKTIFAQITQELFDKSIDIAISEKMVMEALSKAKKENLFV